MTCSKFIIGLGCTIPSTRILKPPGGGSNDLFGLESRQKALLKAMKKSSIGLPSYKNRHCADKSERLDSTSKKIGDALEDSSESNSIQEARNVIETPEQVGAEASSTKSLSDKKETETIEKSTADPPKQKDLTDNKLENNAKPKTSAENNQRREFPSINQSPLKAKENEDKSVSQDQKSNIYSNFNNPIMRRTGRNPYNTLIRNPITGTLTDISSGHKSDPILLNLAVKGKRTDFDRAGIRKPGNNPYSSGTLLLRASNKTYVRRNPITGEGTLHDPLHFGQHHQRLRITQPPGGISSGIY